MNHHIRLAIGIGFLLLGQAVALAAGEPASGSKKKIVFIVGRQSHGWSGHAYLADCRILANRLNAVPAIEATVIEGWPKDTAALNGVAAIIIACDGNGVIGPEANFKTLDALAKKGVGFGFIHYSLDIGKSGGKYLQDWIGGFYDQHWSVNPSWKAQFTAFPDHPVARGLKPFTIGDEWYYHMRFREDMEGVTPILSAIPPESTRQGPDGAHSGNPTVRARKGMAEHVMWVCDRPGGGRGFGYTGGHEHWNYANDNIRRALLNAACWIAGVEVPAGGVDSPRPTAEEMESNLAGDPPKGWTREKTEKIIADLNR